MAETIQDTVDRLSTFISQNYTDIETGPGSVINELLLKLAGAVQNVQYNKVDEISQGAAMRVVPNATTDTYSTAMDLIASNYNTTRSSGTYVQGKIKVTVSSPNNYNLFAGLTFTQPSLNLDYVLTADTRVSSTPIVSLGEVQLYENQGFYYFIIDVQAAATGPEYQMSSGTLFSVPTGGYITDFVKAEAYGNFSSGRAPETDKELVAKIKSNLGSTRFESAAGIANRFSNTFAGFQYLSICGANDEELTRASQNALGISTFGKADIYVRSSLGPEIKQFIKQATKKTADTWEMFISNTDAPGFYYIKSILPVIENIDLTGTLVPTSTVFGLAKYDGQRNNEVYTVEDARFTKYQTATVTFSYTDSNNVAIGGMMDFEVHASYTPNIAEMQDLLLLDNQRLACADYLVKAVIPCMVSLNITLLKKRVTDTYDSLQLQQLKKDIFTYINTIPFGGELHASNIVDICHNYDIKRVDLPIEMQGEIICPDNTIISLYDNDVLSLPKRLDKGVTGNTATYFIDYYRIENGLANPIDNIGIRLI